ncbi:MAG: hypothetical protein ABSG68_23715 [Thermoguttaceae bacterium]
MPTRFAGLGVAFQYPENWVLDEEEAVVGRASVTVYSPGGGFWSVAIYSSAEDPGRLARTAADVLREEYPDAEAEPTSETVAGYDLVGYDLNFFYLDLISTARIRSVCIGRKTYTIYCQAEDGEFAAIARVLEAMTTSLLTEIDRQ